MRLFEFADILVERGPQAHNPVVNNVPPQYPIDPETDLALNTENQWSRSPYLYAVKNPAGEGYFAQIHIPQSIYRMHIADLHKRWPKAPDTLFRDEGRQRMTLKALFKDPRQAAWFAQNVMFSQEHEPKDFILDKLDQMYSQRHDADGHLWNELLRQVPTFEGQPLKSEDAEEFFKDRDAFAASRADREAAMKKRVTLDKNAGSYESDRKKQIKRELMAWFTRMGPAVAKKKFGKELTGNDLSVRLDKEIDDKGINYFLTGPGSVKLKDIDSLKF